DIFLPARPHGQGDRSVHWTGAKSHEVRPDPLPFGAVQFFAFFHSAEHAQCLPQRHISLSVGSLTIRVKKVGRDFFVSDQAIAISVILFEGLFEGRWWSDVGYFSLHACDSDH